MTTHTISYDKESPLSYHCLLVFWNDVGHIVFIMGTLATNICQLCHIEPELSGQHASLPYFSIALAYTLLPGQLLELQAIIHRHKEKRNVMHIFLVAIFSRQQNILSIA
jgi:hypothetical protein